MDTAEIIKTFVCDRCGNSLADGFEAREERDRVTGYFDTVYYCSECLGEEAEERELNDGPDILEMYKTEMGY